MAIEPLDRRPVQVTQNEVDTVIAPGHSLRSVTDKVMGITLGKRTPLVWFVGAAIAFCVLQVLMIAVSMLFIKGIGIWGVNVPVAWGFAIINFVWWIGI